MLVRLKLLGLFCAVVLSGIAAIPAVAADTKKQPPKRSDTEKSNTAKFSTADLEFFEKSVRPILVARCAKCHSSKLDEPKGELTLDSRAALLSGGDSGPAITPGKPDESLLIESINYKGDYEMPPKTKMPAKEIELLTRWVKLGAPWTPGETIAKGPGKKQFNLADRRKAHWCWQPLNSSPPPKVSDAAWGQSLIDRHILAKLEQARLWPSPPADRHTLIRRLYFDLTGLPPSPAEVTTFVADSSPNAIEKVVDHLLSSPHFGEHWARHWLDLVRYAETRGHEFEYIIPNAWEYRDYVIRAFNADVPYNQFLTEHIAGDLMPKPRTHPERGFNESVLATGFWFLGEGTYSPVDIRQDETDRVDNQIDVMTKTFLGVTVACARCHDHKFDAISAADYYALSGYLQSSGYRQVRYETLATNRKVIDQLAQLRAQQGAEVVRAVVADMRPQLSLTAKYLIAARDVLLAGGATHADSLAKAAKQYQLQTEVLAAYARHLPVAAKDPADPLHAWAKIAGDPAANEPKHLAQLLSPLAESWQAEQSRVGKMFDAAEVIVDYRTASAGDWLQDGVTFGSGPLRVGDVQFSDDPNVPIQSITRRGHAQSEPLMRGLKLSGGTQKDPGRLGGWDRAGRMLRTPTFIIKPGRVHYLVRGAGHIYAVVDSHRLNNGPLHGQLIGGWNDTKGQWQWQSMDLNRYVGHGVHLEFSPKGQGDCGVTLVIQSEQNPGSIQHPNRLLSSALANTNGLTLGALAEIFQQTLIETAEKLAQGKIAGDKMAEDYGALANWIMAHRRLFASGDEARRQQIATTAQSFIEARKQLASQVKNESRTAPAMLDGSGVNEFVMLRGRHANLGDQIPRRFLEALGGSKQPSPTRGSGRLELASRMTDPKNPLTSRVIVNRLWHHLFGVGIVPTVDNFGVLGQAPTHPRLLDALASQLMQDGWSIKRTIRSIVLSNTYQMSSKPTELGTKLDPENKLLHRMRIRRLQGEAIRDSVLAISGRLDRKAYGPSVPVFLTPFMTGRGRPGVGPLDGAGRRSIYIRVSRNFLSPMMIAFDTPIPFSAVGRRSVSNVPAQALILMNDPFVTGQAKVWAQNILKKTERTETQRLGDMILAAYGRPASEAEISAAVAFVQQQSKAYGIAPDKQRTDIRPWADLCHVLINVKQFIYVN